MPSWPSTARYNKSMKPLVIFFAGATAAGKTDMAYYLSEQFSLPIFSTDAVRRDAKIKKDVVDVHDAMDEFEAERDARCETLLKKGKPFIYDGSVDRKWPELKKLAEEHGFNWLLIDFDLSKQRIVKNKKMFDHIEPDEMFDKWIADHQRFHESNDQDAQLHITDDNYSQRYALAVELVKNAKAS